MIFLAGCSATEISIEKHLANVEYTAVYMIHGDANYTYHLSGERLHADEEVLKDAIERGKASEHGEVIIFHQKPEQKRLLFFPKKDRKWYHYRGGELVGKGSYSPRGGGMEAEAALYQKMGAEKGRKMFFYFGHEIPSKAAFAYHNSQPEQIFNTRIFTRDINQFEDHFDIVLLSTCNNGNPFMASELAGNSDYMIASPRNLHLSYMDTQALQLLENDPSISTKLLADSMAARSFNRLDSHLQTLITVGVYDLNVIKEYISTYADEYGRYLQNNQQESLFKDNSECNDLDIFADQYIPEDGVTFFFSPPAFGREAGLQSHSAWGCKQ